MIYGWVVCRGRAIEQLIKEIDRQEEKNVKILRDGQECKENREGLGGR
jgi:hypothetical protein